MDNTDGKMSSSAGDTTQNVRTVAMTSNTESEVPSSNQSTYVCYIVCIEFSSSSINTILVL